MTDEVLELLLRKNIIVVDGVKILQDFIQEFPHHARYIYNLVLDISNISDDVLESGMHLRLRRLAEQCRDLQLLHVRAQVVSRPQTGPVIYKEGVVNFFRPLALLPLQKAKVSLATCDRKVSLAAIKQVEQMCETELLSSEAKERPQQRRPKGRGGPANSIKKRNHRDHRRRPKQE